MSDKLQDAGTRSKISKRTIAGFDRQIIEACPYGMILVDAQAVDMPIVYANAAFQRLTGYSQDEVIGHNCRFLQGDDRDQPDLDILRDAIKNEKACIVTLRNYRKDGTMFWNELHVSPIFDPDGQLTYFVGTQNDVTQHENALEQLRTASANLRAMLDSSTQSFTLIDAHARVVDFDKRSAQVATEVFGKPFLRGENIYDYVLERDVESFTANYKRALAGETVTVEKMFDGQDTAYYFEITYYPVIDTQGDILGACMSTANVTERKHMEIELKEKLDELDRFFTVALDLLCIADTDGNFIKLNKAWEATLGYPVEQLEGRRLLDFVHPDDLQPTLDAIAQLDRQEKVLNFVNRYRTYDGDYRVIEWRSHPYGKFIYAAARDITERKQMEEELRRSEQEFRTLAENSPDNIQRVNRQGIHLYVNPACARAMGHTVEGIVGKTSAELGVPAQMLPLLKAMRERVYAERQLVEFDFTYRVDGQDHYYSSRLMPEFDEHGDIISLLAVSRDITERKRAEEALRRSEQEFRILADNIPDSIQRLDRNGKHLYVNAYYAQALDLPVDQIIGKTNEELGIPPESIAFFNDMRERVYASKQPVEFDFSYPVDEQMRYFNTRMIPEFDPEGNVSSLLSVSRDITERKQIEEELRQSEYKFRSLAENAADGLVIWDARAKKYLYTSPGYNRQLGLKPDEALALTEADIFELWHPDDIDTVLAILHQTVENNRSHVVFTLRVKHRDGHYIWQENHLMLQYAPDGTYETGYVIARDITERKRVQARELELTLEKEQRRLLTDFIKNAAHEFRTPLATISTSNYIMLRSDDPVNRAKKSAQIEMQIKRITRLVDSLLLMTRLEANDALVPAPVDAGAVLQSIYAKAAKTCAKKHELYCDIAPGLLSIRGDADYLSDALQQIIDNACRFTPDGGKIEMKAENIGDHIQIEICDDGPGIPQNAQPHIFETFWRQDFAHSTPGFGLGLPIARRIIEQHGGDIHIESEDGQGTTVRVRLPFVASQPSATST